MHFLPHRLKSTFFDIFSSGGILKTSTHEVKKKFQKTLILVFEVTVQPPKHIFEIIFLFAFQLIVISISKKKIPNLLMVIAAKKKIFNFENLYEIWSPNFTIIKCMKLLLLLLHFFLKHVTFFNGIGNFEFKNDSRSKYQRKKQLQYQRIHPFVEIGMPVL